MAVSLPTLPGFDFTPSNVVTGILEDQSGAADKLRAVAISELQGLQNTTADICAATSANCTFDPTPLLVEAHAVASYVSRAIGSGLDSCPLGELLACGQARLQAVTEFAAGAAASLRDLLESVQREIDDVSVLACANIDCQIPDPYALMHQVAATAGSIQQALVAFLDDTRRLVGDAAARVTAAVSTLRGDVLSLTQTLSDYLDGLTPTLLERVDGLIATLESLASEKQAYVQELTNGFGAYVVAAAGTAAVEAEQTLSGAQRSVGAAVSNVTESSVAAAQIAVSTAVGAVDALRAVAEPILPSAQTLSQAIAQAAVAASRCVSAADDCTSGAVASITRSALSQVQEMGDELLNMPCLPYCSSVDPQHLVELIHTTASLTHAIAAVLGVACGASGASTQRCSDAVTPNLDILLLTAAASIDVSADVLTGTCRSNGVCEPVTIEALLADIRRLKDQAGRAPFDRCRQIAVDDPAAGIASAPASDSYRAEMQAKRDQMVAAAAASVNAAADSLGQTLLITLSLPAVGDLHASVAAAGASGVAVTRVLTGEAVPHGYYSGALEAVDEHGQRLSEAELQQRYVRFVTEHAEAAGAMVAASVRVAADGPVAWNLADAQARQASLTLRGVPVVGLVGLGTLAQGLQAQSSIPGSIVAVAPMACGPPPPVPTTEEMASHAEAIPAAAGVDEFPPILPVDRVALPPVSTSEYLDVQP